MSILITGSAGFIGFHLCKKLIQNKNKVISLDNLNNYYSVKLKRDRLKELTKIKDSKKLHKFYKVDIKNKNELEFIFKNNKISKVIHLAAQAGVRHSITNPEDYTLNNLVGFANLLEISKKYKVKKFIYASTSSVYGDSNTMPLSEKKEVNKPIQFYAATKRANEIMAHSYSELYKMNCIGLRFFTVYGPWGRPDMALFKFAHNILNNLPIQVFNRGNHKRDFTYVDDIVHGIISLLNAKKIKDQDHIIYNIGNGKPRELRDFIKIIEKYLGLKSKKKFMNLQKGDVKETFADLTLIKSHTNYQPKTDIEVGIKNFIDWYKSYYEN